MLPRSSIVSTRLSRGHTRRCTYSSWSTGRTASRPKTRLNQLARRHPILLFGFPFCALMVAGSFLLTELTQTRYDLQKQKVTKVNKETELRLESNKRSLSLQEEYWRLMHEDDEDSTWEVKRIERPDGEA
ncbi:cytochrome c oxidase assembly protein COX16-domain-containing protein [Syncephalis plumigaleata]|nr:cytochrome c oxidase assembly protein COX16-domain-containing protein [Syncephalis plumigaleata]